MGMKIRRPSNPFSRPAVTPKPEPTTWQEQHDWQPDAAQINRSHTHRIITDDDPFDPEPRVLQQAFFENIRSRYAFYYMAVTSDGLYRNYGKIGTEGTVKFKACPLSEANVAYWDTMEKKVYSGPYSEVTTTVGPVSRPPGRGSTIRYAPGWTLDCISRARARNYQ